MYSYKANDNRYENAVVRRAGNSGLQLPALSFGLWHSFGDDANYGDSEKVILKAFDLGILVLIMRTIMVQVPVPLKECLVKSTVPT